MEKLKCGYSISLLLYYLLAAHNARPPFLSTILSIEFAPVVVVVVVVTVDFGAEEVEVVLVVLATAAEVAVVANSQTSVTVPRSASILQTAAEPPTTSDDGVICSAVRSRPNDGTL